MPPRAAKTHVRTTACTLIVPSSFFPNSRGLGATKCARRVVRTTAMHLCRPVQNEEKPVITHSGLDPRAGGGGRKLGLGTSCTMPFMDPSGGGGIVGTEHRFVAVVVGAASGCDSRQGAVFTEAMPP